MVVLFGGCFATVCTSSLADALPPLLYSGGSFAVVVVLFGGWFATISCFMLTLPWYFWLHFILLVQVQLFGWPLFVWQD